MGDSPGAVLFAWHDRRWFNTRWSRHQLYASLPAGCAALAVSVSRTAALTWGIGISLGFPACISAAADHPTNADRRVSFVSICGYATFLVGPPTIGFIAEHAGILDAFWLAAGTLAKAVLCAGDTPKSIMNTTPRRLRPKGNVVCRSQNWHWLNTFGASAPVPYVGIIACAG